MLWRFARADRERPDLEALAVIDDPERFVWAILPHAARTFAACIALVPRRSALPCAVAYLYCRMLDTYEDLVPSPALRETSLRGFAARLAAAGPRLPPAPPITEAADKDDRDRAHLLLLRRTHLVDALFVAFDEQTRDIIRDLVRDMAEGMCWSSETFTRQGGVLSDETQLAQYCRHVLGNPTVFGVRILRLHYGKPTTLTAEEREDAMLVGELVQLANVTRDIEKDLRRGVAYDPALRGDLGRDANGVDAGDRTLAERCRMARARMLRLALRRAPAYPRVIDSIRLPRASVARASALLMLLFTERYYRECARRVGWPGWRGPDSTLALVTRSMPASVSRRRGRSEMARIEREFLKAAGGP